MHEIGSDRESLSASLTPKSRNSPVLGRVIVAVESVPAGVLADPVGIVPSAFCVGTMIDIRDQIGSFSHILSFQPVRRN